MRWAAWSCCRPRCAPWSIGEGGTPSQLAGWLVHWLAGLAGPHHQCLQETTGELGQVCSLPTQFSMMLEPFACLSSQLSSLTTVI